MSEAVQRYAIPTWSYPCLDVRGAAELFPVRRIWCIGRNYLAHIREMGHDERDPPFFLSKPAESLAVDGAILPYPPLTRDLHHEVELVVALGTGGRNIPVSDALAAVYGYAVGIDLTRRDLLVASRDMKRPWEIGKVFDSAAPCSALRRAADIGHPNTGRITLRCNGRLRQDSDLSDMLWNVATIVANLSASITLAAGDLIMTGTPAGVGATVPGDTLECEIEKVGRLTVTIGPPSTSDQTTAQSGKP